MKKKTILLEFQLDASLFWLCSGCGGSRRRECNKNICVCARVFAADDSITEERRKTKRVEEGKERKGTERAGPGADCQLNAASGSSRSARLGMEEMKRQLRSFFLVFLELTRERGHEKRRKRRR